MSEPRKLNTGNAPRNANQGPAQPSVLSQQQYEQARRQAQAQAGQAARRRVNTTPHRTAPPAQAQAQAAAQAQARAQMAAQPDGGEGLTLAQRQAMALRRKAEQEQRRVSYQASPSSSGTPRRAANVQQLDLSQAQGSKQVYDINSDAEYAARQSRAAPAAPPAQARPAAAVQRPAQPGPGKGRPAAAKPAAKAPAHGGGSGGKPPKGPKGGKGKGGGDDGGASSGKNGKNKPKKKGTWWKVLLGTLLAIVLIFGGTIFFIMHAIAPEAGAISLSQLINTPKEFQDKEFNILVTGVDRSSTDDLNAGASNDSDVNDGMTDMILYVHFNNETGEMKMLQVPRDTMVTTDTSVSGNYRINGVAKTQGSESNNNMAALCEKFSDMYQLPVDGYITIRLEMLVAMVDAFGGVELNVPVEMDSGDGSHLDAGYQTLKGSAVEFLLRARHVYPDGDIGRLNMQRQFYSALFRKLKSIDNVWDVAKLTPAVLTYMQTDLNMSDLVSFAVSMLKIDSSKIMMAQMPSLSGNGYQPSGASKPDAVLFSARQEDADLLNEYFRENTGYVDAANLNLCLPDSDSRGAINYSGLTATDPNIQFMGTIMAEDSEAQKEHNLDGSNIVTYEDTASSDAAAASDGASSTDAAA